MAVRANRIDARIVDSKICRLSGDELSLDEQQGEQELREDGKVCPIATGIQEAVSLDIK